MNPIYQENLAFENKKAGITSTAVRKAVEAVSKVAKTQQVKVAGSTNSLSGGLYALNGTVRVKVKASYKGGEREITIPIHVRNGVVAEASQELISDKLNVVAKKEIGSFTDVIRNIKRAGIEEIMQVEKDFYENDKNIDNLETLDDGTMFDPNGWTKYKEDNDYVMIYKGKGGIEKGVGDIPFIAVDIEGGNEIGTANTVMQARKIVEDYVDTYYAEASKQAERKMFFVEAGKVEETEKECDYLNNVMVYASTSENAIKLASDFNDGKVEVEEVEYNGKKIAAVVEKQEKKAYKNIDSATYEVIVTVTCDSEEEATKIKEGLSNSYPEVIKNGVEVSVYLNEYSTDLAQSTIENELNELGFHIEASKIKILNKQAKEVTISNGGSNANLPNAVESEIISYSKAHLPDDLEAGDEVNISGKKYKVEAKLANGQESATEWNLRVIKE